MIFMSIPWDALFGGALLGISASLLLLFKGKIAGISGILSGALTKQSSCAKGSNNSRGWQIQFLIGLIAGGALINWLVEPAFTALPQSYSSSTLMMVIAGLFVGFGTKLGNGCTSGHGICGMGRFSIRSIVATMTFMLVAAIVVFIRLHAL